MSLDASQSAERTEVPRVRRKSRLASSDIAAEHAARFQRSAEDPAAMEAVVLGQSDIMTVTDRSTIEMSYFENSDVIAKDIMAKARAREDRLNRKLDAIQRACMWEAIINAHSFLAVAASPKRREAAVTKLKTSMVPLMATRRAAKTARRRLVEPGELPPRPTVDDLASAHQLFRALPPGVVAECVERLECVAYDAKELVVKQGEPCTALYVIGSGRCIADGNPNQGEQTLGPGAVFGGVLDADLPHEVSVFARDALKLWRLRAPTFEEVINHLDSSQARDTVSTIASDVDAEAIRRHFPFTQELLARCEVFRGMSPFARQQLLDASYRAVVRHDGDVLYTEGEPCEAHPHVFILLRGTIKIAHASTPDAAETVTAPTDPGISPFPVLGARMQGCKIPFDATATVTSHSARFYVVPCRALHEALFREPAAAKMLYAEATKERLRYAPKPSPEVLRGVWAILTNAPTFRLTQLADRARIEAHDRSALLTTAGQAIQAVFLVIRGTVARRRGADNAQHTADPRRPETWVRVGGEWEALGLGESWRDEWRAVTEVDAWRFTLQDVRLEYSNLTVEQQQRALGVARRDMMHTCGLTSMPRAVPIALKAAAVSSPRHADDSGDVPHRSRRAAPLGASHTGRLATFGPAASTSALSTTSRSRSSERRPQHHHAAEEADPGKHADDTSRHAREAEFVKSALDLYRPAKPVSRRAKELLADLDEWRIKADYTGRPAMAILEAEEEKRRRLEARRTKDRVDVRAIKATEVAALLAGQDPQQACAVVRSTSDAAPALPVPPPRLNSAAATRPKHRWPEPSPRRSRPSTARSTADVADTLVAVAPPLVPAAPPRHPASAQTSRMQRRFQAGVLNDIARELNRIA